MRTGHKGSVFSKQYEHCIDFTGVRPGPMLTGLHRRRASPGMAKRGRCQYSDGIRQSGNGTLLMIRTGQQYRDSIRDGRQVWINGERVPDVTTHAMFKPLVDIRARIYDMAHEAEHAPAMTWRNDT